MAEHLTIPGALEWDAACAFIIYRQDEDGPTYVTHIGDGVGYFSGPGEICEAAKWPSEEKAKEALEWLNDPLTFYGEQNKHFIRVLNPADSQP
ncbi:MAG: hypothetical protein J6F32_06960 [Pseudomonas sp.]|nr:hypothetical protein [Pseudomonas sp.]